MILKTFVEKHGKMKIIVIFILTDPENGKKNSERLIIKQFHLRL